MKKSIKLIGAICIATTLNAATTDILAVVNGENITKDQVVKSLQNQNINYNLLKKEQQKTVLDKIVEQKLLSQYALNSDVKNDPVYIDTLNKVKENIALQVFLRNISAKFNISNDKMKEYYEKNKKQFIKPIEVKARHILLKTKDEALSIIEKLKKSTNLKDTFINLAKTKSTGPSKKDGGDLGWFTLDKMVPNFAKATSKLDVNKITLEPVKTQFGYHVIYLEDKKKDLLAKFDEVKAMIKQELLKQNVTNKIASLVSDLKKKAKIQYK